MGRQVSYVLVFLGGCVVSGTAIGILLHRYNILFVWDRVAVVGSITAIIIAFAAITALWQLWSMQRTGYSVLLMDLHHMWDSDEFVKGKSLIGKHDHASELTNALKELQNKNAEDYWEIVRIANFFENLGFLGRKLRWPPKFGQVAKSGLCSYNKHKIGGEHETEPQET